MLNTLYPRITPKLKKLEIILQKARPFVLEQLQGVSERSSEYVSGKFFHSIEFPGNIFMFP